VGKKGEGVNTDLEEKKKGGKLKYKAIF